MSNLISVNACDKIDAAVPPEQRRLYASKLAKEQNVCQIEVVDGIFKQSDMSTDDSTFDGISSHFGLQLDSWGELKTKLGALNASAAPGVKYKLVFCARHGQGYHNKVVDLVGITDWDNYWSHLNEGTFNGEHYVWGPDPFLTAKGEAQAKLMNEAFTNELQIGCPLPTRLFSSPFTRSAQTLTITWDGILVSQDPDFKGRLLPLVKEDLRETIGSHTCDKRSTKSIFLERLPNWGFHHEANFTEDDTLYLDNWREPLSDHAIRANRFLQDLYQYDDEIIYCSSHSGEMKALLLATGHRAFAVPTAGMIPLVLKMTAI